jgi:lysozyme
MNRASRASAGVLAAAAAMIMPFEGLDTHAYKDVVGVVTICYGETNADSPVKMGDVDTPAGCKVRLEKALVKYDDGLTACLNRDLPDGVHVVFISTTYNIGVGGFCRSSMAKFSNEGNWTAACDALRLYNRAGGRVIKGLDTRRRAEQASCLKGINGPPIAIKIADLGPPSPDVTPPPELVIKKAAPAEKVTPHAGYWTLFSNFMNGK